MPEAENHVDFLRNLFVGVLEELRDDCTDFLFVFFRLTYVDSCYNFLKKLTFSSAKYGSKKSLIRRLGSILPIKPHNRVYFCVIDKFVKHEQLQEAFSENEIFNTHDLESNTIWLDNEPDITLCRNNTRRSLFDNHLSSTYILTPQDDDSKLMSPRASTPIGFRSGIESSQINANPASDSMAYLKITMLEDELSKLRKQVADIVSQQETKAVAVNDSHNVYPVPIPPPVPTTIQVNNIPSKAIPPPPPPPPPPLDVTKFSKPKISLKDQIKQNKKINTTAPSEKNESTPKAVDMCDVLKGLGSVKLKKVDRSPGGTPIRKAPLPSNNDDPASLIAAALKRRFSKMNSHLNSPDKENNVNWSPDSSPAGKLGPHLLKPAKKASVNFKTLSPLREINVR